MSLGQTQFRAVKKYVSRTGPRSFISSTEGQVFANIIIFSHLQTITNASHAKIRDLQYAGDAALACNISVEIQMLNAQIETFKMKG